MLRSGSVIDLEQHDAIKRRLRQRAITLSDIAKEAGCGLSMVSMVSQGHRSSRTIEALIASKLGEAPETLWPARYQQSERQEGRTS